MHSRNPRWVFSVVSLKGAPRCRLAPQFNTASVFVGKHLKVDASSHKCWQRCDTELWFGCQEVDLSSSGLWPYWKPFSLQSRGTGSFITYCTYTVVTKWGITLIRLWLTGVRCRFLCLNKWQSDPPVFSPVFFIGLMSLPASCLFPGNHDHSFHLCVLMASFHILLSVRCSCYRLVGFSYLSLSCCYFGCHLVSPVLLHESRTSKYL